MLLQVKLQVRLHLQFVFVTHPPKGTHYPIDAFAVIISLKKIQFFSLFFRDTIHPYGSGSSDNSQSQLNQITHDQFVKCQVCGGLFCNFVM